MDKIQKPTSSDENTIQWFTSDHTSRTWSDLSVVIMLSDILYPFMRKTSNGTSWHFSQLVSCCAERRKPLNSSVFTSWGSCPTVSTSLKIHYKLPLTHFDCSIPYYRTLSRSGLWTSCNSHSRRAVCVAVTVASTRNVGVQYLHYTRFKSLQFIFSYVSD
jgi:hypothetical protein